MIFLKNLPTSEMIRRMQAVFPQLEENALLVFIQLLVLSGRWLVEVDRMLADHDLGHGRWVVLMLLRRRAVWQASPSELADDQGVTRATMSGLLRRLEEQKLVARRKDPGDGRRTVITLTDAGARLVERVLPKALGLVERSLTHLDKEERRTLRRLLEKLLLPTP